MTQTKKKIGLALGSGGVKGLAHIGVIKVLEQNDIPIDYIAGTSAGALIGAGYAYLKDINRIEQIALSTHWKKALVLVDPTWKSGGLIGGKKVEKLIKEWLGEIDFAKLKIPLMIIATDLISGKEISLNQGDIIKAIRASSAVPPVFKPVEYENYWLSDGGLSNPLPANIVRQMGAEIVIGVNLDSGRLSDKQNFKHTSLSKISIRALNILRSNLAKNERQLADVLIEPNVPEIGLVGWNKLFDAKQVKEIIKAGEEAAIKVLPQIKNLINS